ncbi:MAG: hypothetical protein AAF830_08200 [Pseudomonadota bacterium]
MKTLLSLSAVAAMALGSAHAVVFSSVDRATFAASVAQGTVDSQDFDGLAAGSTLLAPVDGVTYSASKGDALVTDQFLTTTGVNGLGSTSIGFFEIDESATFVFDVPITAFAIDVNTFSTDDGAYLATLNTGDSITSIFEVFPNQATGQFIGFTTDTAFTSVTITVIQASGGLPYTLDTLVFGDAGELVDPPEVPIPGALPLFLAGVGLFGARKRLGKRA